MRNTDLLFEFLVVLPGVWPPEEAEPVFFPNDNSVKSSNGGGNELQRDEVKSAERSKDERNTPVGGGGTHVLYQHLIPFHMHSSFTMKSYIPYFFPLFAFDR